MIGPRMPSPFGHALAGIAVAWTADLIHGDRTWRRPMVSDTVGHAGWYRQAGGGLTVVCAGLAAAPDLYLLLGVHRTATHSIAAAVVVGVCAGAVAAAFPAGARRPIARVALMCAAAYGSHLL